MNSVSGNFRNLFIALLVFSLSMPSAQAASAPVDYAAAPQPPSDQISETASSRWNVSEPVKTDYVHGLDGARGQAENAALAAGLGKWILPAGHALQGHVPFSDRRVRDLAHQLVSAYLKGHGRQVLSTEPRLIASGGLQKTFHGGTPDLPMTLKGHLIVVPHQEQTFYMRLTGKGIELVGITHRNAQGRLIQTELLEETANARGVRKAYISKEFDESGRLWRMRENADTYSPTGKRLSWSAREGRNQFSQGLLVGAEKSHQWKNFAGQSPRTGESQSRLRTEYNERGDISSKENYYQSSHSLERVRKTYYDYDPKGQLKLESSVETGSYRDKPYKVESRRRFEYGRAGQVLGDRTTWSKRFGDHQMSMQVYKQAHVDKRKGHVTSENKTMLRGDNEVQAEDTSRSYDSEGRLLNEQTRYYDDSVVREVYEKNFIRRENGALQSLELTQSGYKGRKQESMKRTRLVFDDAGVLVRTRIRDYEFDDAGRSRLSAEHRRVYDYNDGKLKSISEKKVDPYQRLMRETTWLFDEQFVSFSWRADSVAERLIKLKRRPLELEVPTQGLLLERAMDYGLGMAGRIQRRMVKVSENTLSDSGEVAEQTQITGHYRMNGQLGLIEKNRYVQVEQAGLKLKDDPLYARFVPDSNRRRLMERDELSYDMSGEPDFHVHQENVYDESGTLSGMKVTANDGYRMMLYEDVVKLDVLGRSLAVERIVKDDEENLIFTDLREATYDKNQRMKEFRVKIKTDDESLDARFILTPNAAKDSGQIIIRGEYRGEKGKKEIDTFIGGKVDRYRVLSTEDILQFMKYLSVLGVNPLAQESVRT